MTNRWRVQLRGRIGRKRLKSAQKLSIERQPAIVFGWYALRFLVSLGVGSLSICANKRKNHDRCRPNPGIEVSDWQTESEIPLVFTFLPCPCLITLTSDPT